MLSEQRRQIVARRLLEAGKALRVFYVGKHYWPNRATEQTMKQAEAAFAQDDYERAAHLAEVVLRMARRDTAKFQADPKAWIAKQAYWAGGVQ